MKNIENWRPSKFVLRNGLLRASRDPKEVGIASQLAADIIAKFYSESLPKFARGKLIDLGCGKVPLYEVYKDFVNDITCVDWANSMHNNPHLDLVQDLNNRLELPDRCFDTIILSDVLEHIRKPESLLSEMNRILSEEGKLLMNVPFYYWLHEQPFDYFRYTRHALQMMAEDNGFRILELRASGGAIEILADISAKVIIMLPIIGRPIAKFTQWLAWHLLKISAISKFSKKTSEKFPFGYFMVAEKV